MLRQTDLAAQLLLVIEQNDLEGAGLYRSEIMAFVKADPDSDDLHKLDHWNTVDYHLRLLATAGLILHTPSEVTGDTETDNFELTWAGHEHLDKNRPKVSQGFFGGGWVS